MAMPHDDVYAGLNPAQLDAVMHIHGPALVLAGAGSGKTRVITHKIARLIESGLDPSSVIAITFTNKAAAEMRVRTQKLIGRAAKGVVLCTFHALGVRMLREDGSVLGLKQNYSILDTHDVFNLIKDAGGSVDSATAKTWQWTISAWKSAGMTSIEALACAKDEQEQHIALIMQRYEDRLLAYQSVDFDDLITLPLKLLRDHEDVRAKWQALAGHVLIDEYQDTNVTQYELLKYLVGDPSRACFTAVGDDDQSIYGWRGATLDNLKKLPLDFPDLKVIKLEQNYRSVNSILRAANNVIALNPRLFSKKLWGELGEGDPISVVQSVHEEDEAEMVVNRIKDLRALSSAGQKDYKNFAILYRANHQARIFEKALRRASMPYKVSGGQSFFERTEIRDICAWLRLLGNEDDDPAFLRAITLPKRGIGPQTLLKLAEFASQFKFGLFESLFSSSIATALPANTLDSLYEFGRYVNDVQHRFSHISGQENAKPILLEWLAEIGYEKHLYETEENEKQAQNRWTNVLDFVDWMAARCGGEHDGDQITKPIKTLMEVSQAVALLSTIGEREKEADVITLSTLHAAKGLEWPHVLLVGVCEGLLPYARKPEENGGKDGEDSSDDSSGVVDASVALPIQEERRLMYVGITRAQRTLQVSWPGKRKKGRDLVDAMPSRFIEEMALEVERPQVDHQERLKIMREQLKKKADESTKILAKF
jgi:ATP-dependent DNA helicase Rep